MHPDVTIKEWLFILPVHLRVLVVCTERSVLLGSPKRSSTPFSLHSAWIRIPPILCFGARFSPVQPLLSAIKAQADHPNNRNNIQAIVSDKPECIPPLPLLGGRKTRPGPRNDILTTCKAIR